MTRPKLAKQLEEYQDSLTDGNMILSTATFRDGTVDEPTIGYKWLNTNRLSEKHLEEYKQEYTELAKEYKAEFAVLFMIENNKLNFHNLTL